MGGGTGDNFSAGTFATNWNKYSDQAKAVLVRDRAHRESLNDFAKISKEYGDQIKKYGNPSGTAQVTAWQKIAGTALKAGGAAFAGGLALFHPFGVLTAGVGMRQLAKMLAKPSGAQQVMRWNRLATAYNRSPSPGALNALQNVTRLIEAQKDRQ
jgi:hypothetical protein